MMSFAMKNCASVSILALSLALGGCATKLNLEAPYDDMTFEKALPEADPPKPVEVVEVPKVLPLPGQLKPWPVKGVKGEKIAPEQAIAKANKAARMEPTRAGYINAIQVYPWTEGALYRLYASPEKVSTIALQPSEELIDVSTGDTVRWVIGDTASGQGSTRRVHILVKPTLPDIQTNLVVLTDRRTYHLEPPPSKPIWRRSPGPILPTAWSRFISRTRRRVRANNVSPIAACGWII
jgi:type IV secretory pathway VirB9-like protein